VTITKYSSKKPIDTFEVIHFSRSDWKKRKSLKI
jgi:hypothetical protein